jgi:hypothetical protein
MNLITGAHDPSASFGGTSPAKLGRLRFVPPSIGRYTASAPEP